MTLDMVNSSETVSPEKRARYFCARTFRQEIRRSDALKSVKKFISATQNDEDVILQYMENGGSVSEMLSLIDKTAKGDLSTALPVFEIVQLILLRFQSPNSKYYQHCFDSAKQILHQHLPSIQSLLTMNTVKHKKVALKLFTAIVTLHSSFASEVLNLFSSSSYLTDDLISPTPEKDSVRKNFILFILSFLVEGNLTVLKMLMDNKGFLNLIIPGLKYDEAHTVNMTLSMMEDKILKNIKISKTLKLKTFNTQIVKHLFDLYEWKGPQALKKHLIGKQKKHKAVEVNQEEKTSVVECVHSFLLILCTSKKHGISFSDKSLGTSEMTNNDLLLSVFESLSNPLSNSKRSELILKILITCPDLVKPTLLKLEPFLQPRNSQNWFEAIKFAENLIKGLEIVNLIKSAEELISSRQVSKAAKALCTPASLLRTVKSGSEKSQPMEVRITSLRLLLTMWEASLELINAFSESEPDLKKSVNDFVCNFLPESEEVVELWQEMCKKEFLDAFSAERRRSFLEVALKSLQIIIECQSKGLNTSSLASVLLDHLEQVEETLQEKEYIDVQAKIIQLVEKDILSLILDVDLFKKSLLISLRSSEESSLSCACKLLSSLEVFEGNKSEIDVWLLSFIPVREGRFFIAECLVYSVSRCFETLDSSVGFEDAIHRTGEMENSAEWPTQFLNHCIATLENLISKREGNEDKITCFRRYLCEVIIHLQHSYPNRRDFYDRFKSTRKTLGKSVMGYLKRWTTYSLIHSDFEALTCPQQREFGLWLVSERDDRKLQEILKSDSSTSSNFYLSFKMAVAHLIMKTVNDKLIREDVAKFAAALKHFLKFDSNFKLNDGNRLISEELNNNSIYLKKCIDFLLNRTLLKSFNVFAGKENSVFHCSAIIVNVLMENERIRKIVGMNDLTENWKLKFLKELRRRFQKNKSIEDVGHFESVLAFFEYRAEEVADFIKLLTDVSDFDIFLNGEKSSKWTTALIKFLKIHCLNDEVEDGVMNNICHLMKYLTEKDCTNLKILDDCFVFLLRRHPRNILKIENDFLQVLFRRSDINPSTIVLGKLLLNHPIKVEGFLEIASTHPDSELVFPLLSVLLAKEKSEDEFLGRKNTEITEENSPKLYRLLEKVYERFEGKIISALIGENEKIILKNLSVAKELIRLFLDKNAIKQIRKKLQKGNLEPELLHEAVKKIGGETMMEISMRGIINALCKKIKNDSDMEDERIWFRYCFVVSELVELNKDSSMLESIFDSSEWKELYKLGLGLCLRTSKHSAILKILRLFITGFRRPETNFKMSPLHFQMLISHSQFLNVILRNSSVKTELVDLFYSLVESSESEMSSKHIPILLASYTATLESSDETILKILRFYEEKGFKLTDFEPLAWGETAISHYSIGAKAGLSLWHRFGMTNVLDLLDQQKMEFSLKEFPISRSLKGNISPGSKSESGVYDPAFLLPLFANLLSPGSVVFPLPFVYKGGLAYTVRALSSECNEVRAVASIVLARFYNHLELTQNSKQKLVWMHFINCFRYGLENISTQPISNIVTLFFARMTMELSQQPAEMLQPLQNFLLAKSYFVFNVIPEFLPLFHSSQVHFRKHREWLLQVLKDGSRTNRDIEIIFHSMVLKVIFCFFQSHLCDNETKKIILQVMEKLMTIQKSILLISQYGLLSWINSIDSNSYSEILSDLINLLQRCTRAIVNDVKVDKCKHTNFSDIIQILNISMKLLPAINLVKSIDAFNNYLKIILNCFVLFVDKDKNEWFALNKHRLEEIINTGVSLLGCDLSKFTKVPFYFREYEEECKAEVFQNVKNAIFVFNLLIEK